MFSYIRDVLRYIFSKKLGRKGISILAYNSVDDTNAPFSVSRKDFRWQMEYLKRSGRHVVSLDYVADALKDKKKLPKNLVVITFDDGYQDNFLQAYPTLKEYNYPASVYVISDRVDRTITKNGVVFPMLKVPQLQKMDREGLVSIESQTKSHPHLGELSSQDANLEMAEGAQNISRHISGKCLHFSYPFGEALYSLKPVAKQLFKSAVTKTPGFVGPKSDLYELNRNVINSDTTRKRFRWVV